jgi:hypothetical protein
MCITLIGGNKKENVGGGGGTGEVEGGLVEVAREEGGHAHKPQSGVTTFGGHVDPKQLGHLSCPTVHLEAVIFVREC